MDRYQFYMVGGAAPSQVGEAAKIRFEHGAELSKRERFDLNGIVHSDEKQRKNGQPNKFYDHEKKYDPKAQAAMDHIKANHGWE